MSDHSFRLGEVLAEVAVANADTDLTANLTLVRESILIGAKTFDLLVRQLSETGIERPELLREGLTSLRVLGLILLCVSSDTADSLFDDLTQ